MKKIIIDTDPGIDDALAIMLAAKSGIFDIKAITTIMGNSTIENTTRNAGYILKMLERVDIPIYSGASQPLTGNFKSSFVMGNTGLGDSNLDSNIELTCNASEKILGIISNNPYEISIIAIGPLTNIAKSIQNNPEIMRKVKEIIIMGGAIKVPGNINRVAEFNIFNDPEAADIVFKFPIKKVLIPLDVCNKVELDLKYFSQINFISKGPMLNLIQEYIDKLEMNETGKNVALVYDALAIYYLINKEAYSTKNLDISIETKGDLTRGMTVGDFRKVSKKEINIEVAFDINKNKFAEDFLNILSKETFLNNKNINKISNEETKD